MTKLIPFFIPADSSMLSAYFECDALNNVLLKWLDEEKSSRMSSELDFKDGKLKYKTKAQPDTVYLPSDTIYISKELPYPVEVDKIVNELTKVQRFFFLIGIISSTSIVVWLIMKLGLKRIF